MLTRVAADPDYAAQRGIKPEVAAQMLKDHVSAGSPPVIPGHIGTRQDKGPTPRLKKKGRFSKLIGSK